MDVSRLLLPFMVAFLALTQVPAALVNLTVLDCQHRFIRAAQRQQDLLPAVAVKFCNGTSQGAEAF